MDLGLNRRKKQRIIISDDLKGQYPHDLNLYFEPPEQEISLSEFEDLALDRLKVLRILEFANNKGLKVFGAEWKNFVMDELNKENLKNYIRLIKSVGVFNPSDLDLQARRADHISHFILRLSYCRSDELRRWFLNREVELFKLRFQEMSPKSVLLFFEVNNLSYKPISEDEKMEIREELCECTSGSFVFETTAFYKVPFTHVLSLVKGRKVFLKKGFAYVPMFEMGTFITSNFRSHLSEALAYSNRRIHFFNDDRLMQLLSNLNSMYTGKVYTYNQNNSGVVHAGNLDSLVKEHYPLCMKSVHEHLKKNHHLAHFSRVQYLFYLKGIGLSYEECMLFWREEFCKKIDPNMFEKNYAYNVKHAFGKVGSMVNYSPYSCIKLIKDTVGPGQTHGCPYKNWDKNILKHKLEEIGLGTSDVNEIVNYSINGHYQIACGKYFECTHGGTSKNVINHPNQYFEDSLNLSSDKAGRGNNTKQIKTDSNTAMEI